MSETQDKPQMELIKALVAFQRALKPIPRTKTAEIVTSKARYSYKYADLGCILKAIREPLAEQGLAILQIPEPPLEPGTVRLRTVLVHSSGESIEGVVCMPASGGAQAYGSALTYARRYGAQAILGIVTEEDDDGSAATPPKRTSKPSSKAPAAGKPPHAGTDKPDSPVVGTTGDPGEYVLPFGKHKDTALKDTPQKYLEWLLENYEKMHDDTRATINAFLGATAVDPDDLLAKYAKDVERVMNAVSGAMTADIEQAIVDLEGSRTTVTTFSLHERTKEIVAARMGGDGGDSTIPF